MLVLHELNEHGSESVDRQRDEGLLRGDDEHLAQRAKGKGARDRTRYSKARSGTKSFLTHHLRRVSKAAVVHDAMAIRKQITCLKQQAFGCVAYAAGAGEVEA